MKVIYSTAFFPEVINPKRLFYINRTGDFCINVVNKTPGAIKLLIKRVDLKLRTMPQVESEVTHTLIEGVYTRTLFIKKGTLLVGKTHLKECVNIVAKGDITVLTENGMGRLQAGHVAVSQPGIQKLGYAHEDTVFINVFRSDKTELADIEAEIAEPEITMLSVEKESLLCL